MDSQLSTFDQASKNVWQVILEKSKIPKWKMDALMVLFGKLTFKSKLSRKERIQDPLYTFELQRTINEITELMEDSEELKQVWTLNQLMFLHSLAI